MLRTAQVSPLGTRPMAGGAVLVDNGGWLGAGAAV